MSFNPEGLCHSAGHLTISMLNSAIPTNLTILRHTTTTAQRQLAVVDPQQSPAVLLKESKAKVDSGQRIAAKVNPILN